MISHSLLPALLVLQMGLGGLKGMSPFLLQMVAIFAIFYFLLIRPQQKQKKQHETALRALKRGDQVVTAGGIVGEVVHVKDAIAEDGAAVRPMEDQITIRSAESRLIVERGRIARIIGVSTSAAAMKE